MSRITREEVQELLQPLANKMLVKAHELVEPGHTTTRQAIAALGFAQNTPYRWLKGEILRVERYRILTQCLFQGLITDEEKDEILTKLDLFWTHKRRKKTIPRIDPPIGSETPQVTFEQAVTFEQVIKSAESFKDSLQACNQRKKEFLELFDTWREKVAHGFAEMVHFRNTMEGILNSKGGESEE